MINVSHTVGRLAEIRLTAPIGIDDLLSLQRELAAIGTKIPDKIVICCQLLGEALLSDDLVDKLAKLLRSENSRIERVALVVADGATLLLQVERLLREGGTTTTGPLSRVEPPSRDPSSRRPPISEVSPSKRATSRRAFRSSIDAITWLDEVLTPDERVRVRACLDPAPRSSQSRTTQF